MYSSSGSSRLCSLVFAAVLPLVAGCSSQADDAASSGESDLVASAGFSLGLHEGVRASHPASKVTIDTQKLTYTGRGTLTFHVYFEPTSEAEAADVPQADLFQASFDLSLDDNLRLFESSTDESVARKKGDVYSESAEASGPQNDRKVILRWDNADGENTRKGELEIALGAEGHIRAAHMTKWGKRFLGWGKVFDDSVNEPTHREHGLLLLDDYRVGRLGDVAKVRRAIDDPSPSTFQELIRP